ncbi:sensor histidine kinase [Pseudalkalibacillus caeni]|uniref:Sensor histidine kinase n=1 Tax=Exobacillus caeni TaxID=2574798 RepID=A0A5R9F559_9BACL|nr:sensor histidine kinase [Pseudalkalibacillus caeni]TLS35953.1 sensor histidine kinase [Pseudalkalibacillus caeni]
MSTVQRFILAGAGLAIIVLGILMGSFLVAFPSADWSVFWSRTVMDLPFIIFVPVLSLLIGAVFGLFAGIILRKHFEAIEDSLKMLERGRQVSKKDLCGVPELDTIRNTIERIQQQISEQTKLSQKLASEKAEVQEKRIQEMVSQERQRLARELHDSVSQQLFAASMMMSAINESKSSTDERETKQLKMVEEMIHQSQLEMRALLLHLRPAALKGKSLQEGIQELLGELTQKVPINLKWKVEPLKLDKGVEDHLFRILQEAVSNILRHSKAESMEVLLIEREGLIILRIADDGIGFEMDKEKTGSYGMQTMHERAVEVGGSMKIVSVPNKGTRLEVRVPMIEGETDD